MATRLDPVRLTKRMVSRDRWAARPFARRLFRKVAARKARSRAAAARAPGLKADAWASTRSKHVHGAPTVLECADGDAGVDVGQVHDPGAVGEHRNAFLQRNAGPKAKIQITGERA